MNSIQKIVFSRTLKSADWTNTRVVNGDVGKEIVNLKRQPGKDIAVFGSANLASTLLEQGLIDEYRIMVNPVLLGSGRPLFKEKGRTGLKLLKTRQFKSGNVLLWYQPR